MQSMQGVRAYLGAPQGWQLKNQQFWASSCIDLDDNALSS